MLAAEPTPGVLIGDQVPVFFSPTDTLVVTA
jgi:hypothetical protein